MVRYTNYILYVCFCLLLVSFVTINQTPSLVRAETEFMLYKTDVADNNLLILYFPRAEYMYTWNVLNDPHGLPLTMLWADDKLSLESVTEGLMDFFFFSGKLEISEIRIRLPLYSHISGGRTLFGSWRSFSWIMFFRDIFFYNSII